MTNEIKQRSLEIHPITQDDLQAVLGVYQQCEDFLALGPMPFASMEMVLQDIEISKEHGGLFCGIFTYDGEMIGIVDYVPGQYQGDPHGAFLSLLMIAAPYRKHGIGAAVVKALEGEIRKDPQVKKILSGVQVNNLRAIQFWQRNGYNIVSTPQLMPDQTTVYALQKDLSQPPINDACLNGWFVSINRTRTRL